MKKIFFVLAISSALISCKKETKSSPTSEVKDSNPIQNKPTSGYGTNIIDKDGNTYKTVFIGKQQWMAENLKVTHYNDGTIIPNVTEESKWARTYTGAWCYFNNEKTHNEKYGKLYNWYSVSLNTNGNKNICPTGWHVPSDEDWTILSDYLGGELIAGGKMKEEGVTSWKSNFISDNLEGSNSSLFTALPGAGRIPDGVFDGMGIGTSGNWWSTSEDFVNGAWVRTLHVFSDKVSRSGFGKKHGLSVRCLKD
jgi:uncharacterized protein (TIGR02145 family)